MNKPLSRLPRIPDWPGDPDIACDISPDDHDEDNNEHNVVGQKPEFDPTWVCGVCGDRHGPDECKGATVAERIAELTQTLRVGADLTPKSSVM